MAQIFKNNTWGALASQLTAGATTATLAAGHNFTDPGTDWYLATLIGVTGTTETAWEIVKVTDVSTNTLTIVRAQEGTTDATWPAGTRIELRLTAGATESKANLGTAAYTASTAYEPADATLLKQANIVNVLNSTSTTAPLSAAQGKALNDAKLNIADIDDTPVNGETAAPISSNWAFDHAANLNAHGISDFGETLVDDANAATARSTLGLGDSATRSVGTTAGSVAAGDHTHASLYQPLDSDLTALAGLSTTGLIERTGDGTAGIVTITTAGKAILDDADAATQRTTLGLGTGDSPQFTAVNIGHASDTTIARVSAGVVSVEGVTVATASNTLTLTNKTLTDPVIVGAIAEDIYTISDGAAFEIDPGNGTIQTITLGASRTPKATNFAAGESVTLMVLDGSAYTLTWTNTTFGTSGVVWVGGTAPALDTTKYTVIELWKVGSQVYGALVGFA